MDEEALNNDENQEAKTNGAQDQKARPDDPTKINIETNPVEIITGAAGFFKSILSLRDIEYKYDDVIKSVREGIIFKGYNVYILMFSILIASIGLNVDSTAVIIGAMLISPLMGPIKGVGFGVGTNDFRLLLDSLKNLGITVGISLLVAVIYFKITPIHDLTDNLFARTEPTFLDVLIAVFGGMAGVIAHTQGKNDTVIPGVAIATALMPPLCTAGYGLAEGNWSFFAGALYLFVLNSLMIAASTYFFVRYVKFPKKEYLTPKIEKRVRAYTWVFIVLAVAPSGYLFYKMTKRSIFLSNAELYVEEVIKSTDQSMIVTPTYQFDWDESKIVLGITNFYADHNVKSNWMNRLERYNLEGVELEFHQGQDVESLMEEKFAEYDASNSGANTLAALLDKTISQLAMSEQQRQLLENKMTKFEPKFKFDHLLTGFKIDYPEYKSIAINESYYLNEKNQLDTMFMLTVEFRKDLELQKRQALNERIAKRFKLELSQSLHFEQDSVRVISLN